MNLPQDHAQRLFEAGGFFILPLEKQGTEFGVDGSLWAVKQDSFAGIKFLPPGLHLFVYSAPPSAAALAAEGLPSTTSTYSSNPLGEGITIRHGLFRFSKPEEVIVRKYDPAAEQVEGVDAFMSETSEQAESSAGLGGTTSKRLKASSGNSVPTSLASPHTISSVEDTIISPEYLKTLDSRLAPYPFDKQAEWKRLTSLISQETVIQVLGVDSNGDCRCDSLMSSLADEKEGAASTSRRSQWGKERSVNELNEMARADTVTSSDAIDQDEKIDEGTLLEEVSKGKERCMRFASFDLKRSWRDGAMGEEITRNSRDKSWLLKHVIDTQLGGSENELLAQMQLAFVIFSQIQNFSALDSYKAYLSMLCRATSTFLPTSNGMSSDRSLRLCADLLEKVLSVHVDYLRNEFFHEDLPGLDTFLQEELGNLRMSLRAAYRQYMPSNRSRGTLTSMSGDGRAEAILTESFKTLHKAWEDLRKVAEAKFGWLLGRLEPDDITVLRLHKGRLEYNLLSEPDEEDEYREEGEDAPVVVEM